MFGNGRSNASQEKLLKCLDIDRSTVSDETNATKGLFPHCVVQALPWSKEEQTAEDNKYLVEVSKDYEQFFTGTYCKSKWDHDYFTQRLIQTKTKKPIKPKWAPYFPKNMYTTKGKLKTDILHTKEEFSIKTEESLKTNGSPTKNIRLTPQEHTIKLELKEEKPDYDEMETDVNGEGVKKENDEDAEPERDNDSTESQSEDELDGMDYTSNFFDNGDDAEYGESDGNDEDL